MTTLQIFERFVYRPLDRFYAWLAYHVYGRWVPRRYGGEGGEY